VVKKRRTSIESGQDSHYQVISWSEAVEKLTGEMKLQGLAVRTIAWHNENLQAFNKALIKKQFPTSPIQITEAMVKEIVMHMIDAGLAPVTINHRVRSLKRLYQFLISEDLIGFDPTEKLERKKVKSTIIHTFTDNQLAALFDATNKSRFIGLRDYMIMLLLLDTGVRLFELANMKLPDIRMAENEIIIPHGKGDKYRRVFFSNKTKETLRKYIRARGNISGNPYLLVNYVDNPITRRNIQERLTIYGKKAKIEGVRVSPHTFRHTFAKLYIMRGGDAFSLQSLLGHSTLDMVKYYVRLWGTDLQKMHRKYSPVDGIFHDHKD